MPEQYSIQKEYPKHSVSRKNLFLYSNLRNNFQTNQKLEEFIQVPLIIIGDIFLKVYTALILIL